MSQMPLKPTLRQRLEQTLSRVTDQRKLGPRLKADAARLWSRVQKFIALNLISPEIDVDALELCCYALQLPQGQPRDAAAKIAKSLRERCEQSAELLVGLFGEHVDESLLDHAIRLL